MKREPSTQIVTRRDAIPAPPHQRQQGAIGWILAWLIGIPIPLLLIIWLFSRAC